MHLKNFSLWRTDEKTITLTPAYDLLATKLLVPDDPEELALPLNEKKSRFRNDDWLAFATYLGLTSKQQTNVHQRFSQRLPAVFDWIETSFLSSDTKQAYRQLVNDRALRCMIIQKLIFFKYSR